MKAEVLKANSELSHIHIQSMLRRWFMETEGTEKVPPAPASWGTPGAVTFFPVTQALSISACKPGMGIAVFHPVPGWVFACQAAGIVLCCMCRPEKQNPLAWFCDERKNPEATAERGAQAVRAAGPLAHGAALPRATSGTTTRWWWSGWRSTCRRMKARSQPSARTSST